MGDHSGSSAIEILSAPEHYREKYRNKVIVAPMVRVSTLPFRLLALDYGADLVYSEETIDWKILRSIKRFNAVRGTTEFYDPTDGTVFLSTCDRERERLIVQLGTSDAHRALKVAKLLEPHVAGIDVNMGCPKEFSIKGGMGAALLTQPDKIHAILTTLVKGLSVPVTCKIRILSEMSATLELCQLIERCGVAAVAVHARRKEERPQHPNHDEVLVQITSVLKIPVIANGGSKDICEYKDLNMFCDRTGTCSVMVARAAMWNCSVLRPNGLLPLDDVIRSYLRYCFIYDNPFTYTKYTIQNMLRDLQESPRGKAFLETQTLKEIASIWDVEEEYQLALHLQLQGQSLEDASDQRRWCYKNRNEIKKVTVKDDRGCTTEIHMPMQFIRGNFCNADLPKMVLNRHVRKHNLADPTCGAHSQNRYFIGYVDVCGVRYQTSCIEKSIRYAEQAAVLVYLHACALVQEDYGFVPSSGSRKYDHLSKDGTKTPRPERQKQQASKLYLGKDSRKLTTTSSCTKEKKAEKEREFKTSVVADSGTSVDVLFACGSNIETHCHAETKCVSVIDTEKRDHGCCSPLSTDRAKHKVFIKSIDEENMPVSSNSGDLNPQGHILRFTEENVYR